MRRASISEAKNNLSALIDQVKAGSSVLIMDRGRPVARLEPITLGELDQDARLAKLVREGVVRPARKPLSPYLYKTAPPRLKKEVSVVDMVIQERREGR